MRQREIDAARRKAARFAGEQWEKRGNEIWVEDHPIGWFYDEDAVDYVIAAHALFLSLCNATIILHRRLADLKEDASEPGN